MIALVALLSWRTGMLVKNTFCRNATWIPKLYFCTCTLAELPWLLGSVQEHIIFSVPVNSSVPQEACLLLCSLPQPSMLTYVGTWRSREVCFPQTRHTAKHNSFFAYCIVVVIELIIPACMIALNFVNFCFSFFFVNSLFFSERSLVLFCLNVSC